eukprot:781471-Pyramimonas_sp.AAC.1
MDRWREIGIDRSMAKHVLHGAGLVSAESDPTSTAHGQLISPPPQRPDHPKGGRIVVSSLPFL